MRRDRLRHSAAGLWSPRSGDWRADAKPMKVEEYLEDGTCVIRAGLPGIDPETDVDITVADGVLHLTATREERSEEDRPQGQRTEFHDGSLRRSMRLPEGAHAGDITATYSDGILEVRIPAPEEVGTPTARIPVTRG